MEKVIKSIILIFTISLFMQAQACAEDKDLKPQSMGVATVLALDTLPGHALFYAGKPVQGTIDTILGTIGAVPFWIGVAMFVGGSDHGCENESDFCVTTHDLGAFFMISSAFVYGPMLLWDGI